MLFLKDSLELHSLKAGNIEVLPYFCCVQKDLFPFICMGGQLGYTKQINKKRFISFKSTKFFLNHAFKGAQVWDFDVLDFNDFFIMKPI